MSTSGIALLAPFNGAAAGASNRPPQSALRQDAQCAPDALVDRQMLAVVNCAPRQIGPFLSEVLVLGLPDADGAIVLIAPDAPVPNGGRLA